VDSHHKGHKGHKDFKNSRNRGGRGARREKRLAEWQDRPEPLVVRSLDCYSARGIQAPKGVSLKHIFPDSLRSLRLNGFVLHPLCDLCALVVRATMRYGRALRERHCAGVIFDHRLNARLNALASA
jgi:hypothetical protein